MMGKNRTKRLALLSLFGALSVVVLYLGSFIEVLDMSAAVFASILTVAAVIEYGSGAGWLVYATASVLSLVLLPQKMPAFMYAVFFGFYPMIKKALEGHLKRWLAWLIKVLIFNAATILWIVAAKWLFMVEESPFAFEVAVFLLANATLILYDVALTRAISYYIFKVRKRFK